MILSVSSEPILSVRDLVKGEQSIEIDWAIRTWGYFSNLREDGVHYDSVRSLKDLRSFRVDANQRTAQKMSGRS